MNAREKASELIVNYQLQCKSLDYQQAKQCALIAVEEMIIQNGELYLLGLAKDYYIEKNAYLFDVKSELQSL